MALASWKDQADLAGGSKRCPLASLSLTELAKEQMRVVILHAWAVSEVDAKLRSAIEVIMYLARAARMVIVYGRQLNSTAS